MLTMHRFEAEGVLALRPQAFHGIFPEVPRAEVPTIGDKAIITVRGPIVQHASYCWDSYESILTRVDEACKTSATGIVLRIDSVGGEMSGMVEAVRALRAKVQAAGKRLFAYVDSQATSAAYALACAAEVIAVGSASFVGSIGVLESRVDATAQNAAYGVRYTLITSGARKTDRDPRTPVNDAELSASQERVDALAGVFFELVAEMRPKLTVDAIRALDAGVFHGATAVQLGLADQVSSFDSLLASAGKEGPSMSAVEAQAATSDLDDARLALQKAAEGEGEDADKARAALKALGGSDDDGGDAQASAPSDDDPDADGDKDKNKPTASASAVAPGTIDETVRALAATVQAQGSELADLKAQSDKGRKAALFQSRPDLAKQLVAALKATPYAEAKKIVDAIPVAPRASADPAAATRAAPTHGNQPRNEPPPGDPRVDQRAEIRRGMGGDPPAGTIRTEGTRQIFDLITPSEAMARAAAAAQKGQ